MLCLKWSVLHLLLLFFLVSLVVVGVGGAHNSAPLRKPLFEFAKDPIDAFLVVHVVDERFAEHPAHNLQVSRVEVQSRIHALIWAQERSFECE